MYFLQTNAFDCVFISEEDKTNMTYLFMLDMKLMSSINKFNLSGGCWVGNLQL